MRKSIIAFCLAGILLLTAGSALAQGPAGTGFPLTITDEDGKALGVRSQCAYQGKLLLLTDRGGLVAHEPASGTTQPLLPEGSLSQVSWLLSEGDSLWGYSDGSRQLLPLSPQSGLLPAASHPPLTLASQGQEDPLDEYSLPEHMVIDAGRLYALYRPQSMNGYKTRLLAWNLEDGSALPLIQPEHLQAVTSYREGRLLGLVMDAWTAANTGDPKARQAELVAFDPLTGQQTILGKTEQPIPEHPCAFTWNPDNDTVYYLSDRKLFARDAGGREALCSYLNNDFFVEGSGDWLVPLKGALCAALSMGQSTLHRMEAAQQDLPLSLYSQYQKNKTHFEALKNIQGTAVSYVDRDWDREDHLAQLLQAGGPDVLFLESHLDELQRMVDRGYLMDLSASPVINSHLARCYPFLQQEGLRGEGVYLVPVSLEIITLTAKPALFAQLGLNMPATFTELLKFLNQWAREWAEEHPNLLALTTENPRETMQRAAMLQALSSLVVGGAPLQFDTPLMRELLAATQAMDTDSLNKAADDYSWMHLPSLMMYTNYSLPSFTTSMVDGPLEYQEPLVLQPVMGVAGGLPVRLHCLAINARTKNPEAALKYAEAYVANLPDEVKIMLYPGENTSLQPPGMEERILAMQEHEQTLTAQISQAEGAQRSQLEEELQALQARLASQLPQRYTVSPEVIATYREHMARAFVQNRQLTRLLEDSEFHQLFRRWQQGQISLDIYLKEADSKLRLMQLEE